MSQTASVGAKHPVMPRSCPRFIGFGVVGRKMGPRTPLATPTELKLVTAYIRLGRLRLYIFKEEGAFTVMSGGIRIKTRHMSKLRVYWPEEALL